MQIFLDPEAIKIKQNQLLQTLESWGPTFSISVEIKITSFQKQEAGHWGEILRLTSRPGDCCLNGQRVPVVFLSRANCIKSLLKKSLFFRALLQKLLHHFNYWK